MWKAWRRERLGQGPPVEEQFLGVWHAVLGLQIGHQGGNRRHAEEDIGPLPGETPGLGKAPEGGKEEESGNGPDEADGDGVVDQSEPLVLVQGQEPSPFRGVEEGLELFIPGGGFRQEDGQGEEEEGNSPGGPAPEEPIPLPARLGSGRGAHFPDSSPGEAKVPQRSRSIWWRRLVPW